MQVHAVHRPTGSAEFLFSHCEVDVVHTLQRVPQDRVPSQCFARAGSLERESETCKDSATVWRQGQRSAYLTCEGGLFEDLEGPIYMVSTVMIWMDFPSVRHHPAFTIWKSEMMLLRPAGLNHDRQHKKHSAFHDPTSTSCPACLSAVAAHNPAIPAPTTITLRGMNVTVLARVT